MIAPVPVHCFSITYTMGSGELKWFSFVYLQHHKDQLEVVVWVKCRFKKASCKKKKKKKMTFFSKKVFINSQAFPGIRICDKNNLSTRAHHLNNTKI